MLDVDEVPDPLDPAPDRIVDHHPFFLVPAYDDAMHEFGNYKVSRLVRAFTRGRTSAPGQPPGTRSGQGRHSITYALAGRVLSVGTNLIYLGFLHFGGVIRPRKAKALTIPIAPEAEGKRARDFDNTFILKPKPGDPQSAGIIMQKIGDGPNDIRPLFALRKSVRIAPRPWLKWEDRDGSRLLGILWRKGEQAAAAGGATP